MNFTIIGIERDYYILQADNRDLRVKIEKCNLPPGLEYGDTFHHIEHQRYDIRDKDGRTKFGLIPIYVHYLNKIND